MKTSTADILSNVYSDLSPKNGKDGGKFHRLARAVEEVSKHDPTDRELNQAAQRMRRRAESAALNYHFLEFSKISSHLNWIKNDNPRESERNFFLGQDLELQEEGFIHANRRRQDDVDWLSFWLPEHEKQTFLRYKQKLSSRRDLFDELTREFFLPKLFDKVASLWPETGKVVIGQSLDDKVRMRTRFLNFAHKQFLQNVMCHAFGGTAHNHKFNKKTLELYDLERKDYFFGSIAYLDLLLLNPMEIGQEIAVPELESIHPSLGVMYEAQWDRMVSTKSRILIMSYCDIGPGIERHFIQFGKSDEYSLGEISTKDIIDGRLTGRETFASGQGLHDVRKLAKHPGAKLVFETANSIYLFDGQDQNEVISKNSRTPRGTCVSIIVEI